MPQDDEERRRAPAEFKKVEDIDDTDARVSLVGTAVDVEENNIAVDDGTGTIEVNFDLSKDLSEFKEGDMVRVVGKPSGGSLEGEVAQSFEGFDIDLYEEALDEINKLREEL